MLSDVSDNIITYIQDNSISEKPISHCSDTSLFGLRAQNHETLLMLILVCKCIKAINFSKINITQKLCALLYNGNFMSNVTDTS